VLRCKTAHPTLVCNSLSTGNGNVLAARFTPAVSPNTLIARIRAAYRLRYQAPEITATAQAKRAWCRQRSPHNHTQGELRRAGCNGIQCGIALTGATDPAGGRHPLSW
jgi:hypothetical protein